MSDLRNVLERIGDQAPMPEPAWERIQQRRDRKRRNQRISAGAVGIAVFAATVWIVTAAGPFDRTQTPAQENQPAGSVDYMIDLNTGVKTPLPEAIIRSVNADITGKIGGLPTAPYAVAPVGTQLAYVGTGDEGSPQIFIAGIDGTGVRQMTHDPTGARSPAWSPDGTTIAYEGYGNGHIRNLFVLDVATGKTTRITDGDRDVWSPQFTPDGTSLLYMCCVGPQPLVLTVPVTGGESTILFGRGRGGMGAAGNGSMSPDGSLVTMMGNEPGGPGAGRFVANADGTGLRSIPGADSTPAGTWSPDGSRIVCSDFARNGIYVVEISTGESSHVAEGKGAIWLDDHTLLVEA